MKKMMTGLLGGRLSDFARRVGEDVPSERAIPGDRAGQAALLRANRAFREILLGDLTDRMVEVAAFVVSEWRVVAVAQRSVRHEDAGREHIDTALEIIVQLGDRRVTLIALSCGISALEGNLVVREH